jgi:hypothetical protein
MDRVESHDGGILPALTLGPWDNEVIAGNGKETKYR